MSNTKQRLPLDSDGVKTEKTVREHYEGHTHIKLPTPQTRSNPRTKRARSLLFLLALLALGGSYKY